MSIDEMIPDGITEVVVTTVSANGIPNAAPMGIVRRGERMFISMYSGTKTLRNVLDTGYLVANFTTDPMVYVVSAFEDLNCDNFIFEDGMALPRLKGASALVYFKGKYDGVVELEPVDFKVIERRVPRFSRGFSSVIEATIVGTRLRFYKGDEGKKKLREYEVIVKKCGSPRDIEAMQKLKEILGIAD